MEEKKGTIDSRLEIVILDDDKNIPVELELKLLKDGHPEEKIKLYEDVNTFLNYARKTKKIHVAILDKYLENGIKVYEEVVPSLVQKFAPLITIIITAYPEEEEDQYLKDQGARTVISKGELGVGGEDFYNKIKQTITRYQENVLAFHEINVFDKE